MNGTSTLEDFLVQARVLGTPGTRCERLRCPGIQFCASLSARLEVRGLGMLRAKLQGMRIEITQNKSRSSSPLNPKPL